MYFPPKLPFSTYFFALSHAPPAFDMVMASMKPEERAPIRRPASARRPMRKPTIGGESTASAPGVIISMRDDFVAMTVQSLK